MNYMYTPIVLVHNHNRQTRWKTGNKERNISNYRKQMWKLTVYYKVSSSSIWWFTKYQYMYTLYIYFQLLVHVKIPVYLLKLIIPVLY